MPTVDAKYPESLYLYFVTAVDSGLAEGKDDSLICSLLVGFQSYLRCCSFGRETVAVLAGGPCCFVAKMLVPLCHYSGIAP